MKPRVDRRAGRPVNETLFPTENPLRFHPESKMPSYGPPTLTHQEIEELTRYMATLRGVDLTKKPEYADTFPEPSKPKEKSK